MKSQTDAIVGGRNNLGSLRMGNGFLVLKADETGFCVVMVTRDAGLGPFVGHR